MKATVLVLLIVFLLHAQKPGGQPPSPVNQGSTNLPTDAESQALISFWHTTFPPTHSSLPANAWAAFTSYPWAWANNGQTACAPGANASTWNGVQCSIGRVTALALHFSNMYGPVSPALGNLSQLDFLILDSNALSGTLPASLGNLKLLTYLNLAMNWLSGTVPPEWGGMANLKRVQIQDLPLVYGSIPASWSFPKLEAFRCLNNNMSGPLPVSFGDSPRLMSLDMSWNSFTGSVPASWGSLQYLSIFSLTGNPLTPGTLPAGFRELSYLRVVALGQIGMTGTYPFGPCTLLQQLNMSHNRMGGTLPEVLADSTLINMLDLSHNHFRGTLPSSWSSMVRLTHLDLSSNWLTGTLPEYWGNFSQLTYLDLTGNWFTGTLPVTWAEMNMLDAASVTRLHSNTISSWPSFHKVLAIVIASVGVPSLTAALAYAWSANVCGVQDRLSSVWVVPP